MIRRLLTKNTKEIPLFFVLFNYKKYRQSGKEGSCDLKLHPLLTEDEELKRQIKNIIDYIRDNYNMDKML